jgi:phosphatidylglycerol lysyltransferase
VTAAIDRFRNLPMPKIPRLGVEAMQSLAPAVCAGLVFISGVVMLVSTATPDYAARLRLISALEPLTAIETSHFVTSLTAVALLFLAFGLNNRLRKAWRTAIVALLIAAFATLAKGLNYEEALFLSVVALVLVVTRPAFYRTAPLRSAPLSRFGMVAILAALAAAVWLGFFTGRHVEYRDDLWWTFVADRTAPRALRGAVGAAVLALALFAWRLSSHDARPQAPSEVDAARIDAALAGAEDPKPDANLAYLGDKLFIYSASGESFIQYAARGRTWVAMGEPVGRDAERKEMIWAFRELCDRHGARPAFYSVRREHIADFIDCGLVVAKIGERALVPLADFSLEGPRRAPLRHAVNRGRREGMSFEVVPPEGFDAVEDELKSISDAWLDGHSGSEKGFSLGRFEPHYLRRFPVALVRREGAIVAFANLWPAGDTVAVDLMRHPPGVKAVMDYLFTELMLWSRDQGYAWFDLGMAPLSGLETRRLAPPIARIGAAVYERGGRLYGFEGLRAFKSKFAPEWQGSYIAATSRWLLPRALGDTALLSSGGLLKLFR